MIKEDGVLLYRSCSHGKEQPKFLGYTINFANRFYSKDSYNGYRLYPRPRGHMTVESHKYN